MPDKRHYLRRVAPQHMKPKFLKWLSANLQPFFDGEVLLKSMDAAFDLDYSIGAQMDVTGDIVGRGRVLSFDPADGSSPILDDDTYRMLQRAKIVMNQWDGTIPGAMDLWDNLFPHYGLVIQDNQDMTMELIITGTTSSLERELIIRGYLGPKPMGVLMRFNFVMDLIRFTNNNLFIFRDLTVGTYRFANVTKPRHLWNGETYFDGTYNWGDARYHGISFVNFIMHTSVQNPTFPAPLWNGVALFDGSINFNSVIHRPGIPSIIVSLGSVQNINKVGDTTGFI